MASPQDARHTSARPNGAKNSPYHFVQKSCDYERFLWCICQIHNSVFLNMDNHLFERIFSRVKKSTNGCWVWNGSLCRGKFPQIYLTDKPISVIRIVYQHFKKPLKIDECLKSTCTTLGCVNPEHMAIWNKWIARGKIGARPKSKEHEINKFLSFVRETKKCWLWQGAILKTGYGIIRIMGKPQTAHRASYQLFVGKIKKNFQIDHLCCNKICVNPKHLEQVTGDENKKRARLRRNK